MAGCTDETLKFSTVFSVAQMENVIAGVRDANLKLTLAFGIGLHHAGLHERDRRSVEELFVNSKIQVRTMLRSGTSTVKRENAICWETFHLRSRTFTLCSQTPTALTLCRLIHAVSFWENIPVKLLKP